jgi:hypothetical protein
VHTPFLRDSPFFYIMARSLLFPKESAISLASYGSKIWTPLSGSLFSSSDLLSALFLSLLTGWRVGWDASGTMLAVSSQFVFLPEVAHPFHKPVLISQLERGDAP